MAHKEPNTVKGETVIFLVLAFLVPLWPISLPLFLWLAYKSYKKGDEVPAAARLDDVVKAKQLLEAGAISQAEFDQVKARALQPSR